MRQRSAFLFVASLLTVVSSAAQPARGDDAKDLQGTWKFVNLEANGEKKAEEFKGWKFVVEGDQAWVVKPEETGK